MMVRQSVKHRNLILHYASLMVFILGAIFNIFNVMMCLCQKTIINCSKYWKKMILTILYWTEENFVAKMIL